MKLRDYLTELFTTKVDLDIKKYPSSWTAKFRVDNIGYEFSASQTSDPIDYERGGAWEVQFYHWNSRRSEFPDPSPIRVFGAVVQSMEAFIKRVKPKTVWFSPSARKLSKLYNRFEPYMKKAGYERDMESQVLHIYRKV